MRIVLRRNKKAGPSLTRLDAVQLKVVTRRIDAVKMRVCGWKGGEKQPPSGVESGDISPAAGVALLTALLLAPAQ
jgi:hypothetical protein